MMPECSVGSDSKPFLNLQGGKRIRLNNLYPQYGSFQPPVSLTDFKNKYGDIDLGLQNANETLQVSSNPKKFHFPNERSVLLQRGVILETSAKLWHENNKQMELDYPCSIFSQQRLKTC